MELRDRDQLNMDRNALRAARETRIGELIKAMTLEEKASQLLHESPAIERLGIPAYNWWSEALHGVARSGAATIFPQAIGMAAMFDETLLHKIAEAISDEGRAKCNIAIAAGRHEKYAGLTFWTPNINIFRDPRWGRGQESYGEDPYLTARLGAAFIRGLQGDDADYLKTAACAKHYAVHSGPEKLRHIFDAVCSDKDLWETYLPAFKALVDAGVESVMGAYNRTLGEPCCGSAFLLEDILRGRWGFKGHVVSDCWAIRDFHEYHKVTKTPEESAALALRNGCDLNCGCSYPFLTSAVRQGLISEDTLDQALSRLLSTRFKLGILPLEGDKGTKETERWDTFGPELVDSAAHRRLARLAAEKSLVLLKNEGGILPLRGERKQLLLIGPSAANIHSLIANYYGLNPRLVTILEGITEKLKSHPEFSMDYHQGCGMYDENRNTGWTIGMAEQADIVIACFGLDNALEGEEGDAIASASKGDRVEIELPKWQLDYLRALRSRGKPLILILTGGSPIAIPEDIADAILFVWYPGEEGGNAVADALFGDIAPSGKLPISFPASTAQLPPYEDYAMAGRTYRYMEEEALYPFGFGLSYTRFEYRSIKLSKRALNHDAKLSVRVQVANTGGRDAEEVVQLYISKVDRGALDPICSLRGFKRIKIAAGKTATLRFLLDASDFESVDGSGESRLIPGEYRISVGGAAPLPVSVKRGAPEPVSELITVPDDGYELWLRYRKIGDAKRREEVKSALGVVSLELAREKAKTTKTDAKSILASATEKAILDSAVSELKRALSRLIDTEPRLALIETTNAASGEERESALADDAYSITSDPAGVKIRARSARGLLYGAYGLIRAIQTGRRLSGITIDDKPRLENRILNHWDNYDGSIERGYAGKSLWHWSELPGKIDRRYIDYARACASIGINGSVVNNVNAYTEILLPENLRKVAALAGVFRAYGIRTYLSINFTSPIKLGALKTADPLNPDVAAWWRAKADEIYELIPDFGGFLIKADSEGQAGPYGYGRDHAQGANVLAQALERHGGIVIWRAFVYGHGESDRAKKAYADFMPLDGHFKPNVAVQAKNGPIDFQPREPIHPLFGAMEKTNLFMEFQIAQEYLGQGNHVVYLAPMWKEILDFDTQAAGPGSTLGRVLAGEIFPVGMSGIAAVANTGDGRDWCGSIFHAANWYAYGRLAWDYGQTAETIADEWINATFAPDKASAADIKTMMMDSWEACIDYMTPLGLHHIMREGHHYGPDPSYDAGAREDWRSTYYHRADAVGLGFDRGRLGSGAVDQYRPPIAELFNDIKSCPEKYLVWFHHVPWNHILSSGRTFRDELIFRYDRGVKRAKAMLKTWEKLKGRIDPDRYNAVLAKLKIQCADAEEWRDICVPYFMGFADGKRKR